MLAASYLGAFAHCTTVEPETAEVVESDANNSDTALQTSAELRLDSEPRPEHQTSGSE